MHAESEVSVLAVVSRTTRRRHGDRAVVGTGPERRMLRARRDERSRRVTADQNGSSRISTYHNGADHEKCAHNCTRNCARSAHTSVAGFHS